MIGHFPIHPLTLSAQKVFIFRYLQPLAEYQEVYKVPFMEKLAFRGQTDKERNTPSKKNRQNH